VHFTNRIHSSQTRSTASWAITILLTVAALAAVLMGPQVATAATAQPAFPHLATWWPDAGSQTDAKLANCDWVALQNGDASHIAGLRAANPSIIILGYTDARELNYVIGDYNNAVNVVLRSASTDWVLTQVGSVLTSGITTSTTTIPVADVTKFAVGEMVLVDHEYLHIDAIGTSSLTVSARPTVNPASAHAAGARIASLVTSWPGTVTFDLSTNCPKRDVGYGLETWSDWNVRRGVSVLNSANWDGLLIDCLESNASWMVSPGRNRSIDPLRTNVAVTDNYAAFNTAWNAGAVAYGNNLKTASGNKILIGNGNMRNFNMNGNIFEEFPYTSLAANVWNIVIPGPYSAPHASYADWCANSAAPNLTLIQVYGSAADYRLMRFGLTTALMNNGYFSYAPSSSVHAHDGLDWFDEYDNAGAGRGYLGQPSGAARSVGSNVWRRDYTGGVVLVNPSDTAVTVQLGGTYRKIKGTQDPTVNDGSTVTAVTIPGHDGIILLTIAATATTPATTTTSAVTPTTTVTTTSTVAPTTTVSVTPVTTPTATTTSTVEPATTTTSTVTPVTTTTPTPTATLTLSASATTIKYGQTTTLRTTVTPASAATIHVDRRQAGTTTWQSVATLTADASGALQYVVTPLATTEYRTVVVSTGLQSKIVKVGVQPRATIKVKGTVAVTKRTLVSGAVTYAGQVTVVLQRLVRGHWTTVKRIATKATGSYSARVSFKRGTFRYRIILVASTSHMGATSATVRVRAH
jgi:hypothetical protein